MTSGNVVRGLAGAAVALVIGLALGGLGPRAEIRGLKKQLAGTQECETRGVGRELASAFSGKPWEAALDKDEVAALDRVRADDHADDGDEDDPEEGGMTVEWTIGDDGEFDPEDLEQGMQMAKDAMSLRQAQARAALDEQAQPSDEQWDAIDDAMNNMNADLNDLAQEFVDTLVDGEEPSRRDAMIFAADTLDVILEADDSIFGALDSDQRSAVEDEAIDPLAHIDPELLNIFLELDR
jgi:hypothetical protein